MLRHSILRMAVLVVVLSFPLCALAQSRVSTYGKEFWAVFMSNYREPRGYHNLELSVSVAAKRACTVTLEHYGIWGNVDWSDSFSVPADSVYKYIISDSLAYVLDPSYNSTPQNLRITSTDTVTVYSANFLLASMDASNILPKEALGTEYILQTFVPRMPAHYSPYHSMFAVTATENSTTVTIIPSVPVVADTVRPQGVPIVRTLNKGQTLFMRSANMGASGDLSGTRIASLNCKKIAVFQGNELTFVPNDTNGAGDHIYSQAMPVSAWGKEFVVTNTIIDLGLSRSADVVRITASQNNTVVKKNGTPIDTLVAFQTCEVIMRGTENSAYFETSSPSAVYMYLVGMEYGNNYALGDPSMVWVPPLNQTSDSLLFDPVLPADSINQLYMSGVPLFYYANIVTKTADTGKVFMDSTRLVGWQTVAGNSAYSYLQDTLYPSVHLLHGTEVLAFVYGLGNVVSYAHFLASKPYFDMFVDSVSVKDTLRVRHFFNAGCPIEFASDVRFNHDSVVWDFGDGSPRMKGDTVSYAYLRGDEPFTARMLVYTSNNCERFVDSVVFHPIFIDTLHDTIHHLMCAGAAFDTNGYNGYLPVNRQNYPPYYLPGFYVQHLVDTASGCRHDLVIDLQVNDTLRDTIRHRMCVGQSFDTNGHLGYRPVGNQNYPSYSNAGSYTQYLRHPSTGCFLDLVVEIALNDTLRDTIHRAICEGTTFDTLGRSYSTTGMYTIVVSDSYRCLHNLVIDLWVKDTFHTIRKDTICRGNVFTYNGLLNYRPANPALHDTSILYRHVSRNGCDSIVHIQLHVSDTFRVSRNDTICRNAAFVYGNNYIVYTPDNARVHDTTFVYRHYSVRGCDSTVVIRLHIKDTAHADLFDTICRGDVFTYGNGLINYRPANAALHDTLFIYRHHTAKGCDSNVYIRLHINDTFRTARRDTICRSDVFTYDGLLNYSSSNPALRDTVIFYTHRSVRGCDSTVVISLHINDTFRTSRNDTICRGYAFTYGGLLNYLPHSPVLHDTVIIYKHLLAGGCDSTVVIRLHVNDTFRTERRDTICRDAAFTYGGLLNYRSVNPVLHDTVILYRHTTVRGCDSTVVIRLHIKDTAHADLFDTICRGDVFTYGNGLINYRPANAALHDTLFIYRHHTAKGCDSNVYIRLHINDTFRTARRDTICRSDVFTYDGLLNYSSSNPALRDTVIFYTHRSVRGCDSTVVISLHINDTFRTERYDTICTGKGFVYQGVSHTVTENFVYRHQTVLGCDSVVAVHLWVKDTFADTVRRTICKGESFDTNGASYSQTGVYRQTYRSADSCLSNLVIALNVLDTTNIYIDTTICAGSVYIYNDTLYNLQGVYYQRVRQLSNCDLVTINITVPDTLRDTIHTVICAGASFDTNGHLGCSPVSGVDYPPYTVQGVYTQYLRSSEGCFHNLVIDLTVNDTLRDTIHPVICAGASFDTNGHLGYSPVSGVNYPPYTVQGVYTQYLRSSEGCFHNLVIDLTVNDTLRDTVHPVICAGASFDTNGHLGCSPVNGVNYPPYTVQGVYTQYLRSSEGCFHNLVIDLTVNDTFRDTVHPVLCKGMTYFDGNDAFDSTGVYTLNYFTRHGCDSVIVIDLVVLDTVRDSVHRIVCSGVTFDTLGYSFYLDSVYRLVVPDNSPCGMHYLTVRLDVLDTLRDTINRILLPGSSFDTNGVRYFHQGSYVQRLRDSISRCFHNFYINISVLDTLRDTVRPTICAGASYDTNGSRYYIEDVYKQLNRDSVTGAFSILMIYLRVNDTIRDTIDRTVCAGVSFDTNGYSYSQPGQYLQHLRQPDSCYNNLLINITVSDTLRDTIERVVCAGASFDTNGERFHHPGRYIQHLRQSNGCLNNLVIDIIVNDTIRDTIDRTVCAGVSFDTNGYSYSQPGHYLQHLRQPDSCYNNLLINITVSDTLRDTIERVVCAGASFDTNGDRFHHPGQYIQHLRQPNGCFNNLVIDIIVNDTIRDTIDRMVCAGVSFDTNGMRYYQPGQYTQHLRQPDSCYNNLVINISVQDTLRDTIKALICAGYPFDTNGHLGSTPVSGVNYPPYFLPGVYTQYLRTPDSCYLDFVIELSIQDTIRDTIYRTVCAGVSFDTNGSRYYQPGQYIQHLRQPDSCYNNLVINIAVLDTVRDTIYREVCAGVSFDTNGSRYYQPGQYIQHLRQPDSCYNNLVINISVRDTVRDTIYREVCAGASFDTNGQSYLFPGTFTQHLRQPDSCYNNLVIVMSVRDTIRDTIYRTICAGETFDTNGRSYAQRGVYTQYLRDPVTRCYNDLVIFLIVNDTFRDHIYDTVCAGMPTSHNGIYYYMPGTHLQRYQTVLGCDSIVAIHLFVRDTIRDTVYREVCAGASFDTNGMHYYFQGIYTQHLRDSVPGCFHNLVIDLTVRDTIRTHVYDTVCEGTTYRFNSTYYTTTGVYRYMMKTAEGCDSITYLHLQVNPVTYVRVYDTSYTNVYHYHDSVYTRNGVYRYMLQREGTGCDSMVELHLWFCDSVLTKVYDTICNDSIYRFGNEILTRSGVYYRVVPSHLNCDSIIELHLKVVDYPQVQIVDSGGYCKNGYATLRVVTDGNRIVWSSFPLDSSLFGQEGNSTIYVSPSRHTIYTVEVDSVPRVRTCRASASVGIHKASTVKAQMARDPMETTMANLQTKFADISVGNVVYREWLFHETSPLAPDKRYEYDSIVWFAPFVESDSFRVRLAVRNDVGCTDTVVNIYPILKADLWVPNAFTPDENLNTLFKVGAYNLAEYEIYIYNRAGLLVFHSTDPDDSWDGTHKGKPCIPASYVYIINYKTKVHPKQPQKKVGSVLLIR